MKKEPFWRAGPIDSDKLISKAKRVWLYNELSSAMSEILEGNLMDNLVSENVIDALKQSWKGHDGDGSEAIALKFNGSHIVAVPSQDMSDIGLDDKKVRLSVAIRQAIEYNYGFSDDINLPKAEKELLLCLKIVRDELKRKTPPTKAAEE